MNETLNKIIIILILLVTLFIVFTFIGCVGFSPWVLANNGIKFMPWCL